MKHLLFELIDTSYEYGKIAALKKINFSVEEGENVAILGANGSGKTTLLQVLDGLIFPSSGTVKAFGNVLTEEVLNGTEFSRFFRKKVGLLFQNPEVQLFSPTVYEEIAFGPMQLEMEFKAEEIMKMLEIEHLAERAPFSLSFGEKKKVAIASVLSTSPDVLLLDEPTGGLDPRTRTWFIEFLNELRKKGKTIITATHELDAAREIAERAIVLTEEHTIAKDSEIEKILSDRELLTKVNLIHEHAHKHEEIMHAHEHAHLAGHEHQHF